MTGGPQRQYADFPARPPDRHPDTLMWMERIEAARLEEAPPTCGACGCSAKHLPETRRCLGPCGRVLPIERYSRNRAARGGGRHYVCSDCDAARKRTARQQQKVAQFRVILAAVAS